MLSSSARKYTGHETAFMHWALGLEYPERPNTLHVCEGVQSASGNLVSTTSWRTHEDMSSAIKVTLGDYDLKESTVNAATRTMINLGQYNIDSNNCQNYIHKLLGKLRIPMPKNLITSQSLVTELGMGAALYGGVGSSALM